MDALCRTMSSEAIAFQIVCFLFLLSLLSLDASGDLVIVLTLATLDTVRYRGFSIPCDWRFVCYCSLF